MERLILSWHWLVPGIYVFCAFLWPVTGHADCSAQTSQDSFHNQILFYSARGNPVDKAILVLPPTGGENVADRTLATSLCEEGLNVYILDYAQKPSNPRDLTDHDRGAVETLTAIDRFLATHQERSWAAVGASLGSLYASMAFGIGQGMSAPVHFSHLTKLKALVLTVAGGSLAEILATSQLDSVVTQRQQEETDNQIFSNADYQKRLSQVLKFDPLHFATPHAKSDVLMFTSDVDTVVPAATQEHLWHAWGEPERTVLSTSHAITIGRVYFFYSQTIFNFLSKRL